MSGQKTILIITPFFRPNLGGAETYISELCEYFRKHNYCLYVLTYQPISTPGVRGERIEKSKNIVIRRFKWIGYDLFHKLQRFPVLVFLYITPYLFLRSFLWMLKNHKKIDIIDAQGLNAAFIARILKCVFKKKATASIVALYNFIPGSCFARMAAWALSGLDLVLVEKGKSKEELTSIGIPKNKFIVFNQWVDQKRFKQVNKNNAKNNFGWGNEFIVLFVGRAIPEKGAKLLLEASRDVDENIIFAFITGKSSATQELVEESTKRKNIKFLGEIDPGQLHKYYQAADIFCLPSIYEEGVVRVVSEAVSCGIPVIASNKGSVPYMLDESVSILVEPTADNFAKKIEYLYKNPERLELMARNCHHYALKNFGQENTLMIDDAYQKLIS